MAMPRSSNGLGFLFFRQVDTGSNPVRGIFVGVPERKGVGLQNRISWVRIPSPTLSKCDPELVNGRPLVFGTSSEGSTPSSGVIICHKIKSLIFYLEG